MVLVEKNLPAKARDTTDTDSFLSWEDPLEEGRATHSNILAWKIPRTEEAGRVESMVSQKRRTCLK